MTCREFTERLDDYVADALDARTREAIDRHLLRCTCCRADLRTYRKTIEIEQRALRELERPAGELPEELVYAILAARAAAGSRPKPCAWGPS